MFHTYVQASSSKMVDIDRASFLMDKALFDRAIRAMKAGRDQDPNGKIIYDAQWVWVEYCARHLEKYGMAFTPDIDPTWDQ